MNRLLITIFFFLISVNFSFAQDVYQIRETLDLFRTNKMHSGDWKKDLDENSIQGSPFLNDEFEIGTIYTTSKLQYNNVPLRYNIYNDNLEFKTPENKEFAMATPEIVKKAKFGEFYLAYIPYSNVKKIRNGFFKILIEGNASLYAKCEIQFKEPTPAAPYKDPEPAKFINKPDTYYIRMGMEEAKKVGSKKEVVEMFPEHGKEIADFIKKNKIKTNNPESLTKLVRYYNSLN